MGYQSKKPKGLKIKKTDTPYYYTNKEEEDTDHWWNDKQIIDYFGTKPKSREWPPWTSQYGFGNFMIDYEKYNQYPMKNSFNPNMNEHYGYRILNALYKRGKYRPGGQNLMNLM
jgi:hypothetical protein